MDAFLKMDLMIAQLEKLADLPKQIVPEAARVVQQYIRGTEAAGVSPYGEVWQPRKDGKPARLPDAQAHTSVGYSGNKIRVTLTGPEALHHFGRAKGGVRRTVIPNRNRLPQPLAELLVALFERMVKAL